MKFTIQLLVTVFLGAASVLGDVSHILEEDQYTTTSTPPPPPHPYIFSYEAGRYPGHVDRKHTEVSDGSGTVRGSFSYVDPRQEVRSVEYVADQDGFHASLSHTPEDTEAGKLATARHFALYNKIAETHSNPDLNVPAAVAPVDSASVAHAKQRHFNLYDRISEEHARIGAEQLAERLAFEATSEINQIEEHDNKY